MTIAKDKRSAKKRYWIPYEKKADILESKRRVASNSLHHQLHELKQTIGPVNVLVASAERYMTLSDGKYKNITELAEEIRLINEKIRRLQR